MGKHFAISDGKKARLYSLCSAISEEAEKYREKLLNFYQGKSKILEYEFTLESSKSLVFCISRIKNQHKGLS